MKRLSMYWMAAVLLVSASCANLRVLPAGDPETGRLLDGVKRIVFLGDSITYAGDYVVDFECWLLREHPSRSIEVLNLGLPSETACGLSEASHMQHGFARPDLHERLARVLVATEPDLVIACYGMNDGIYLPLDASRFAAYREGIIRLHASVEKAGAKVIHLTCPVYDSHGATPSYDRVLTTYSEWVLEQRKDGWKVIDIHGPMADRIAALRRDDPDFTFAKDGVHPDRDGHAVMAQPLLAYFGGPQATVNDDEKLRDMVKKRMAVLRDAWLTSTGHKRPMSKGLPLEEAKAKAAELTASINELAGRRKPS